MCGPSAARSVEPPISIGLFGDWEVARRFMQQMEKFNRIRAKTRELHGKTAYCSRSYQLWFNAWHYVSQDIWARFGGGDFDGLAEALALEKAGLTGRG